MITAKELLVYLTIKYKGNWDNIYRHIKTRQPLNEEELKKALENVDLNNFIAMTDEDYPESLKGLEKPPFVVKRERDN